MKKWGVPTHQEKHLVTWVRDDGTAILRLLLPDKKKYPYALPILKVLVFAKGYSSKEML